MSGCSISNADDILIQYKKIDGKQIYRVQGAERYYYPCNDDTYYYSEYKSSIGFGSKKYAVYTLVKGGDYWYPKHVGDTCFFKENDAKSYSSKGGKRKRKRQTKRRKSKRNNV
jgi:hypothetical protein